MGQSESAEVNASPDQLSRELAIKFAQKCFTQLELYCFKEVFSSLADSESDLKYWSEGTICRYLELPDVIGSGPVIYQMASFLGAFPFPSQAPSILTFEAMVKVVTIMTERYSRVLKKGNRDRMKLFYSSLAVFDRKLSEDGNERPEAEQQTATEPTKSPLTASAGVSGYAVDEAANDDEEQDNTDDDELALAALESLDAIEVIGLGDRHSVHHSIIPTDNMLRLIQLLLLIAPLEAQESVSRHADRLTDTRLKGLRDTAKCILNSFGADHQPGISFKSFKSVVTAALPYMFDGFNPLFEHFLFEKEFDLSKRKKSGSVSTVGSPTHRKSSSISSTSPPPKPTPPPVALPQELLSKEGEILDLNVLSQLAFFIKGDNLFKHLHPLYSGAEVGFSMGSFEKAVFNWRAPSLLLVSGTLLPDTPSNSRERTFAATLPPKRFPNCPTSPFAANSTTVTYGVYVPTPWKHTHRQPFGTADAILFQLHPTHDVFRASSVPTDYATFVVPPAGAAAPGIAFGSPLRESFFSSSYSGAPPAYAKAGILRRSSNSFSPPTSPLFGSNTTGGPQVSLGPVSLYLDDALEFAVFTHTASGGGSYRTSGLPGRSKLNWQDRFEVEALEVWGCGGDEEAEGQRRAREWEDREARLRKEVNLGRGGDLEADRELLRMAGLVGHDQGGSMG